MIPIPYAREAPYDRREYVARMADLMLRRADMLSEHVRRQGEVNAARWLQMGNVAMSTMGQFEADRERQLRAQQQAIENRQSERRLSLEEQRVKDAAEERRTDNEWRRQQFRETTADRAADRVAVGDAVTPSDYDRVFRGTSAEASFERRDPMAARLPARPMADEMGYQELPMSDMLPRDTLAPVRRTMSTDTAARPERFERVPTQAEAIQIGAQRRQDEQFALTREDRLADNRRADDAADATRQFREAQLGLSRERLQTTRARLDLERRRLGMGELTNGQMGRAIQLTNSLKAHPAYTDMTDIHTGLMGVMSGLKQKNGFGDIAAINAFQRMVDPGATVREGDVYLLQSANSLLDRILTDYPIERLREGDKLPEPVRARMIQTARDLYATRSKNYNDSIGTQYEKLAEAAGVPFELVGQRFDPNYGNAGGGGWFDAQRTTLPPMQPVTSHRPNGGRR